MLILTGGYVKMLIRYTLLSLVSIRQPGPSEGGDGNASGTAIFLVKISLLRRFALRMRTIDKHARSFIFSRSLMACLKPGDRFLRSFMTIFLVKAKFMTLPYAVRSSSLPSALGMRVPPQRMRRRQVARRRPLQREIKAGGRNCWKRKKKKTTRKEEEEEVRPSLHLWLFCLILLCSSYYHAFFPPVFLLFIFIAASFVAPCFNTGLPQNRINVLKAFSLWLSFNYFSLERVGHGHQGGWG